MRSLNLNALLLHGITVTVDTNLGKPAFPLKATEAGIFILAELLVSMGTLYAPWRSSVQIEKIKKIIQAHKTYTKTFLVFYSHLCLIPYTLINILINQNKCSDYK